MGSCVEKMHIPAGKLLKGEEKKEEKELLFKA